MLYGIIMPLMISSTLLASTTTVSLHANLDVLLASLMVS